MAASRRCATRADRSHAVSSARRCAATTSASATRSSSSNATASPSTPIAAGRSVPRDTPAPELWPRAPPARSAAELALEARTCPAGKRCAQTPRLPLAVRRPRLGPSTQRADTLLSMTPLVPARVSTSACGVDPQHRSGPRPFPRSPGARTERYAGTPTQLLMPSGAQRALSMGLQRNSETMRLCYSDVDQVMC